MPGITITVNGTRREVQAAGDTPLLYVLRNDLELSGPQFGCGLSQCGACSVLVNGKEARSCVLTLTGAAGKEITTLEGLPDRWAKQKGLPAAEAAQALHPVQQAWIDEQVPQCGFCQNGQIMTAKALLDRNPHPTDAQIREGMARTLCRCMTYYRVQAAIKRVAKGVA
jgi:aerobic-type carbon monoxide dehydrogenase small subunit (CoxS/CutS family)